MPSWESAKRWLRTIEVLDLILSLPTLAKSLWFVAMFAFAAIATAIAWVSGLPGWVLFLVAPTALAGLLLLLTAVHLAWETFKDWWTSRHAPFDQETEREEERTPELARKEPFDHVVDIPQAHRELIRECREIAGEIHDALTGIRIPYPNTPPEQAVEWLHKLDGLSGVLAEYEELHETITQYKRCVLQLLPEFSSTHFADAEKFAAILAPEKSAYHSVLRTSARLLGIRPP